jgi:hypothetical protein
VRVRSGDRAGLSLLTRRDLLGEWGRFLACSHVYRQFPQRQNVHPGINLAWQQWSLQAQSFVNMPRSRVIPVMAQPLLGIVCNECKSFPSCCGPQCEYPLARVHRRESRL